MSVYLTSVLAKRVSDRMHRDGYAHCTPADVEEVWESGTLASDDAALASAILQEFDELGIEPSS